MDLFRFKKSIKIFMCSILTIVVIATSALSFSFTSSAMVLAPGIETSRFLASFYSFLLSGKTISDILSNPFDSSSVTTQDIDEVMSFFEKCNEYQEGLGDDLKSAVYSGALTGSISLSEQDRADFLEFLEYCKQNNISIPLYENTTTYGVNTANYVSRIVVTWHTTSNPTIYEDVITITAPTPYFIGLIDPTTNFQYQFRVICQGNTQISVNRSSTGSSIAAPFNYTNNFVNSDGVTTRLNHWDIGLFGVGQNIIYDTFATYFEAFPGMTKIFTDTDFADIFTSMVNTGHATLTSTDNASVLVSSDDVISITSAVNELGQIIGDFVMSIPDFDTLTNVIYGLKNGILTLKDALAALKLSTVSDSATVSEKEVAIQNLAEVYPASTIADAQTGTITVPIGATSTITDSVDEMSAVQHITHSIANTIADIRGIPRPYPDENPDAGPAGDPYLDGWEFPSLDPDNPDPGGTDPDSTEDDNRAADVVNGLAFVSGFIGSFYNASKGYNMVFTVGISFVIFSVIIGASHFFGAMFGSHVSVNGPSTIKELNASREAQIRVQQRAYQKSLKQKRLTG